MACNGVGTPRILLNSKSPQFPDGLANRSGLVGKNLMFHPVAMATGVFEERLDTHKGPNGCCILSKEFYETDPDRGFVRGYNMQVTRGAGGPLATAMRGLASGDIPWGPGHHEKFRQRFDHTVQVLAVCEDLPEECNRVTLDPELAASNGIPAVTAWARSVTGPANRSAYPSDQSRAMVSRRAACRIAVRMSGGGGPATSQRSLRPRPPGRASVIAFQMAAASLASRPASTASTAAAVRAASCTAANGAISSTMPRLALDGDAPREAATAARIVSPTGRRSA